MTTEPTNPLGRSQCLGMPVSRVDHDHWPAWIDHNPALFAKSIRAFLAEHPAGQWDCRISSWAYGIVRLTAIGRATPAPTTPSPAAAESALSQYATSGPLLDLDVLLADLVQAVYDACERAIAAEESMPAIDDVGIDQVKAIQRWAAAFAATPTAHAARTRIGPAGTEGRRITFFAFEQTDLPDGEHTLYEASLGEVSPAAARNDLTERQRSRPQEPLSNLSYAEAKASVLADPATRYRLRERALQDAELDPVDAAADAEVLAQLAELRLRQVLSESHVHAGGAAGRSSR